MYIQQIHIKNIRSIRDVTIDFGENPAGWHVILGENGSGKTTVARAIALGLLSSENKLILRQNWSNYLGNFEELGLIEATNSVGGKNYSTFSKDGTGLTDNYPRDVFKDIFTASFGPFRRFSGGNEVWDEAYQHSFKYSSAHFSLFSEAVSFAECLNWLKNLDYRRKDKRPEGKIIDSLIAFINKTNLLPFGATINEVNSDGIFLLDPNGCKVNLNDASDGYRSILSLAFELIRQMIFYPDFKSADKVFENAGNAEFIIPIKGIVIIDEIDAHLHPTWQTEIGFWFQKYFPKIQFIVTTHSPLVCRAATGNGTIWKLAKPGSDEETRKITGQDKDRLLLGNLLDAYGTDAFGTDVSQSDAGRKLGDQLAMLSLRAFKGTITKEEKVVFENLKAKMPSVG
jgi:energy-coupling factor transporter ATP-binding protein EcfA2